MKNRFEVTITENEMQDINRFEKLGIRARKKNKYVYYIELDETRLNTALKAVERTERSKRASKDILLDEFIQIYKKFNFTMYRNLDSISKELGINKRTLQRRIKYLNEAYGSIWNAKDAGVKFLDGTKS